jgi:hypothetical protein
MKFLFITGWQRSGTTYITRILNSHPNITLVSDPFIGLFKVIRKNFYKKYYKYDYKEKRPMETCFPFDESAQKKLTKEIANIKISKDDLKRIEEEIKNSTKNWPGQHAPLLINDWKKIEHGSVNFVMKQILNIIKKEYGNKESFIVGFKKPYCEHFIESFIDGLKLNTTCLHIIRDIRNSYNSRNSGAYFQRAGKENYSILFTCRNWRKSIAFHIRNRKRKSNYFCLKFENYLKNKKKFNKKICKILNLSYSSAMENTENLKDGLNKTWKTNSSFASKKRKELAKDKERFINFLVREELLISGYNIKAENEIKDKSEFEQIMKKLQKKEKSIRPWQKYYGFTLSKNNIRQELRRKKLLSKCDITLFEANRFFLGRNVYNELKKKYTIIDWL